MDTQHLEVMLEELCQLGCRRINIILQQVDDNEIPNELQGLSDSDCTYLCTELKSIMSIYGDKGCQI